MNKFGPYEDKLIKHISNIPNAGYGVFSTVPIAKGDNVVQYKGDLITEDDANFEKLFGNDYLMDLDSQLMINGDSNGNISKFINCVKSENKKVLKEKGVNHENNLKIIKNLKLGIVYLQATKNIRVGDELFVPYSASYWKFMRNRKKLAIKRSK
jgi:uncharacterized protein